MAAPSADRRQRGAIAFCLWACLGFVANTEGKFEALLYHMVHEEELGSIKGHFGPLHTLCWLPNGRGYVSGGEDGYARLYKFDDDYFNDDKFD